jgi:hypothetical protein
MLSRGYTGRLRKRDKLLTGERGGGGDWQGVESYDRKKAWSSITPSILSVVEAPSWRHRSTFLILRMRQISAIEEGGGLCEC